MREILFRGKNERGSWEYGFYVKSEYYEGGISHLIIDADNVHYDNNDFALVEYINPDTLCEYTGLTDKSGSKVFEGDIFKLDKENITGVVRYGRYSNTFNDDPNKTHIGFYVEWNDRMELLRKDLGFWCKRREVVGNIFDNPEIVETKRD